MKNIQQSNILKSVYENTEVIRIMNRSFLVNMGILNNIMMRLKIVELRQNLIKSHQKLLENLILCI